MLSRIFTPQAITLAAAIESLIAPRIWPEILASRSHLSVVFLIFAANYAFLLVYHVGIYPFFMSPLRHMPGPKTGWTLLPRSMAATDRSSGQIFLDVMNSHPGQDMLLLNVFRHEILVTKPRPLADLLVHRAYDFVKPEKVGGFLKRVLGDGLIVVEGDKHKFLRKNSQPAFSFRHIKDLYPMMWSKANSLAAALEQELRETTGNSKSFVELNTWASRATLDIIGSAGLGREFNMLQKAEDPLLKVYETLLDPTREKMMYFVFSSLLGHGFVRHLPWQMNNTFDWIVKSLDDICRPMMREKREAIEKGREGDDKNFDVLSLLIKSDNFSDRELIDQLLTYLAAGHETTSSALSWASYLLAKHPHYQTALREEISSCSSSSLNPSSSSSSSDLGSTLESLPLLNGIINETLRLYPTVPVTIREAVRDTRLADQFIPRGTRLVVSPWATNRSEEIWGKGAGEFVPERWISVDDEKGGVKRVNGTGGEGKSNYNFLTFLHGPRSCIGQGFARAELRCLLASMVKGFEWEMGMDEEDVVASGVITIKPAKGMWLRMRKLDDGGQGEEAA